MVTMNTPRNSLEEEIQSLELRLLHADLTATPNVAEELLSEEFEEIGSNGRITGREQVREWLRSKRSDEHWNFTEFRARSLSTELVLATYRATKVGSGEYGSKGSRRCSLWKCCNGNWRMVFHQATGIAVD
jgi:hypothetical protein